MMHDWGFGWGAGMFLGPLFMIAGPLLFLVLAVVFIRWMTRERDIPRDRVRSARDILDERFAKGEIDREDYEARRKTLGA